MFSGEHNLKAANKSEHAAHMFPSAIRALKSLDPMAATYDTELVIWMYVVDSFVHNMMHQEKNQNDFASVEIFTVPRLTAVKDSYKPFTASQSQTWIP